MKQKTAIRQLIEKINEAIEWRQPIRELGYDIENEAKIEMLEFIRKKAQELELVNEQQIIDAHIDGINKEARGLVKHPIGKTYFNETFEKP